MAVFFAAGEKDVLPRFADRNPVVLVISIDVSPRGIVRRDPSTDRRQSDNTFGLKPRFPGI